MKNVWPPQDQVLWYLKNESVVPCANDMHVDVAIVGGGMAGLSAAQEFCKRGKKVALFEQYYCGSGATGKSSGFIVQNAELSFTDFAKRYNFEAACQIWDFISSGVADISKNIKSYDFDCGYIAQDSLMVASDKGALKNFRIEYENLTKFGYKALLYDQNDVQGVLGSKGYFGGVVYEDTFGIDAYRYCQEMKKHLKAQGVLIFEETPVTKVYDHTVTTARAQINAEHIVVCVDRFLPELHILPQDVYHAQNYLLASSRLTEEQIRSMFPKDTFMVWDSELLYNYFRMTADNRLLVGGGDIWTTYSARPNHEYERIIQKFSKMFYEKFPQMDVQFEYAWSGLIGLSKDIGPIAGPDKDFKHVYYIAACAGLPIASALGRYSAEHLLDGKMDLDVYFSPYRKFPIGGMVQSILGNGLSFALSNALKQNIP